MRELKGISTFFKAAAMTSILVVAGCGSDPGDRALSGGMIGAGAGAIIGAATGTAATGAAIGAMSGAAIGAATSSCDLDLGDPYWRDHGGRDEYYRRCGRHYRHHDDREDLRDDNDD